ncbi:MAG: hypothetical protein R3F43_25825 [bacterium]
MGGCTNEIELPSAPNMRAVVQRFEVVDGTLDAESAPLLLRPRPSSSAIRTSTSSSRSSPS